MKHLWMLFLAIGICLHYWFLAVNLWMFHLGYGPKATYPILRDHPVIGYVALFSEGTGWLFLILSLIFYVVSTNLSHDNKR